MDAVYTATGIVYFLILRTNSVAVKASMFSVKLVRSIHVTSQTMKGNGFVAPLHLHCQLARYDQS